MSSVCFFWRKKKENNLQTQKSADKCVSCGVENIAQEKKKMGKENRGREATTVVTTMKVSTLLYGVLGLIVLYQMSDYTDHWHYYSILVRKYSTIATSEECTLAGKYFGVSPRVEIAMLRVDDVVANCSYAKEMSTRSVHAFAFMSFCESKYVYKAITMDGYAAKIITIVLLLAIMYFVADYYKNAYNIEKLIDPIQKTFPKTRHNPRNQLMICGKGFENKLAKDCAKVEEIECDTHDLKHKSTKVSSSGYYTNDS